MIFYYYIRDFYGNINRVIGYTIFKIDICTRKQIVKLFNDKQTATKLHTLHPRGCKTYSFLCVEQFCARTIIIINRHVNRINTRWYQSGTPLQANISVDTYENLRIIFDFC